MKKRYSGYSLFELLIAIVILSLLIITSYLVLPKLIDKAFDAQRKVDLDTIKKNLDIYYTLAGEFPIELPKCDQSLLYKDKVILSSLPCDPVTKKPYYYQTRPGSYDSYRLYTILENNNDVSIAKVGCLGGCGSDCIYNYGVSSVNIGLVRCSYACSPSKTCILFNDPELSGCKKLFWKDSTCNNECSNPANRCHDESGKNIPY